MNDQLLEFNGHEIFNDSNFERNEEKSIFGKKSIKSFFTKGGIHGKYQSIFEK